VTFSYTFYIAGDLAHILYNYM